MKVTQLQHEETNSQEELIEKFAVDVLMGLCSRPKSLPSKYFYDDKGSQLFQKITQQPDYYPTSCEFEILEKCRHKIPEIVKDVSIDIIELGAGDGHKTKLLVESFVEQARRITYYPVDISAEAMSLLNENIKEQDGLDIHGVVGEYIEGLRFVRKQSENRQLVLFLGSNIGNFNFVAIQGFLRKLWKSLNHGDLVLIGFDKKKPIHVLTRAYNDAEGVTRSFNLNFLNRINRELRADFDLEKFDHFGVYNPVLGAMESYLVSSEEQDVYVAELERRFHFEEFEPIHLEYSFKFTQKEIQNLAKETGFKILQNYTDSREFFIDSLWEVQKHK